MKIIEKIVDISTGEETIVEREETKAEAETRKAFVAELAKQQAETEAKAQAKAELLAKLGITEDEARLLLG